MQKKTIVIMSCLFVLAFVLGFAIASAQEKTGILPIPMMATSPNVKGTVNCFDYYKFGSVQVDIASTQNNINPGETLKLKGKIVNNNNYPIVDGVVYVKVFRNKSYEENAHNNGSDVVDQFFAKDQISLDANEQKDITFDWKVPSSALKGKYRLSTYFVVSKKFNLLGLSFTDDVTGNVYDFTVKGNNTKTVVLSKDMVKLDGKDYYFAAFNPKLSKDQEVSASVELENSTDQKQDVPISWTLYSWDALDSKNIIEQKQESVAMNPREKKVLNYTIKDNKYAVYYLVVQAKYQDTQSILGIRFVRDGVDQVRINFPSLTSFPLKKSESNTLFSCVHGAGTASAVKDNKLVLTLLDENSKEIYSQTYSGDITGAMMGLKYDFAPKDNYDKYTLKAELFSGNKLVDSSQAEYDCQKINPSKCFPEEKNNSLLGKGNESKNNSGKISMTIGILLALTIVLIIAGLVYKKRKSSSLLLLFFIISLSVFCSGDPKAEANSVVYNKLEDVRLYYEWSGYIPSGWAVGLTRPYYSITYQAKVINADTGTEIVDKTSIPIGTKLSFQFVPFDNTDISWNGSGYSWDTPYGRWINNAGYPMDKYGAYLKCDQYDFLLNDDYWSKYVDASGNRPYASSIYPVYIPFSVNPPQKSLVFDPNNTAGLLDSGFDANGNKSYTVTSPGNIKANFIFDNTYGKFYYNYWNPTIIQGGSCLCGIKALRTIKSDANQPFLSDGGIRTDACYNDESPHYWTIDNVVYTFGNCDNLSKDDYVVNIPAQTISYNLTATPPNQAPVAAINSPAEGTDIIQGKTATFGGTGTDTDGTISQHEWFSGSGCIGASNIKPATETPPASFSQSSYDLDTSSLSLGSHAVSYRVYDNNNAQSNCDSRNINVVKCAKDENYCKNNESSYCRDDKFPDNCGEYKCTGARDCTSWIEGGPK
jgi:hypothetical protein